MLCWFKKGPTVVQDISYNINVVLSKNMNLEGKNWKNILSKAQSR